MHNLLSPGAINAPLLERVSAHIAAHPDSIYMGYWANGPITYDKTSESRFNPGAQACIGSWALALSDGHLDPDNFGIAAKAREVLWLDEEQGANLFYSTNWPLPLFMRLERARTRDEYASVVRERIAAFIQSGGRDGRRASARERIGFFDHASVQIGNSYEVGLRPLAEGFERLEEMLTAALGVPSNICRINNDHHPDGLIAQIGRQYRLPESGHTYHPLTGEEGSSTGFSISGNAREGGHLGQRLMLIDDPTRLTSDETRAAAASWLNGPLIERPNAPERLTRAFNSLNPAIRPIPLRNETQQLIEYTATRESELLRPNGGVGLTGTDHTHYLHRDPPRRSAPIGIDWGADGRMSRATMWRNLYEGTFLHTQQPVLELTTEENAPR